MTIPPDLEAQILRYYHVEKWRVGTIARQLHVHHGTVARVLAQAGLPRIGPPARRSQVEPYPLATSPIRHSSTVTPCCSPAPVNCSASSPHSTAIPPCAGVCVTMPAPVFW